MGRPTKLTPEAHAQIVKALTAGATRTDAAQSAGVHYESFLNWMEVGRKAKSGKFFEFFCAVTGAESEVRISLANALAVAGKTDWRAAAEYLKRRDRANWGDAIQANVTLDKIEPYEYGIATALLARRPTKDSPTPGKGESGGDGPPLGEDADGG